MTINGDSYSCRVISVAGATGSPVVGDIVELLGHYTIVLREVDNLAFTTTSPEDGKVYLQRANGTRQVIAVEISWKWNSGRLILDNPLTDMSPTERRQLWGVVLGQNVHSDALVGVDLETTCLHYTVSVHGQDRLPDLPPKVRYLRVGSGFSSHDSLKALKALVFLKVDYSLGSEAEFAGNSKGLTALSISSGRLPDVRNVEPRPSVRSLTLKGVTGLGDMSFLWKFPSVKHLDLSGSDTRDLSALSGLPGLITVNASRTRLEKLPSKQLLALEAMTLLQTPCAKLEVERFRALQGSAKVFTQPLDVLEERIRNVDEVLIKDDGSVLLRLQGKELEEFLGCLELVVDGEVARPPTRVETEFRSKGALLAVVGGMPGSTCWWVGWSGPMFASQASQVKLDALLKKHGLRWDEEGPKVRLRRGA